MVAMMPRFEQRQLDQLRAAPEFDPDWYCAAYPDVVAMQVDPAAHYLAYGHRMNRDPGPWFSTLFARTVYRLDSRQDPVTLLAGGSKAECDTRQVLRAAGMVARRGDHVRALALAARHLPGELAHTAEILRANAALVRGDTAAWQRHFNDYLTRFDMAPITLAGEGTIFDRLSCGDLPPVTDGPLVSVIMPAWNAEATVAKAAQSILSQTWRNLELLIVDDASDDGTSAVIRSISDRDPRVRFMRNAKNVGPYVSKNVAVSSARGEWITGHDADDWAHPQRLEHHVREATRRGSRASLTYMIRLRPSGLMEHFSTVGSFSIDGVSRVSSISVLFRAVFLRDTLGYWDSVRFGADSEMIARTRHLLGDGFVQLPQIGMICLDLDESLTNDPQHGIRAKNGKLSDARANYKQSWENWHRLQMTPANAYLSFPQKTRRYAAVDHMVVDPTTYTPPEGFAGKR